MCVTTDLLFVEHRQVLSTEKKFKASQSLLSTTEMRMCAFICLDYTTNNAIIITTSTCVCYNHEFTMII